MFALYKLLVKQMYTHVIDYFSGPGEAASGV